MFGLALGLAGFALGAVGLMAMGTVTPKMIVLSLGVLLIVAAVAIIARSVLALRGGRASVRVECPSRVSLTT